MCGCAADAWLQSNIKTETNILSDCMITVIRLTELLLTARDRSCLVLGSPHIIWNGLERLCFTSDEVVMSEIQTQQLNLV